MSDLKRCGCCGLDTEIGSASCSACGEASWIVTPEPPPPVLTSAEEQELGIHAEQEEAPIKVVRPPTLRGPKKKSEPV